MKKVAVLLLALVAMSVFAGSAAAKARSIYIWDTHRGPAIRP